MDQNIPDHIHKQISLKEAEKEKAPPPFSGKDKAIYSLVMRSVFGIGILIICAGVAAIMAPGPGMKIFDTAVKVLGPLATLIFTYYFATKSSD